MPDWDKAYRETESSLFGLEPTDFVRDVATRPGFNAKTVLCLADGDGRNGRWLAGQGFTVTAIDLSAVATEQARALDREAGVDVTRIVCNLADWSPDTADCWDAVFVIYLQCESDIRNTAIAKACAHLREGGWLIAEGFARQRSAQAPLGPRLPDLLYDFEELRSAAGALAVVEADVATLHLTDGTRHQGRANVARFLAQRQPSDSSQL